MPMDYNQIFNGFDAHGDNWAMTAMKQSERELCQYGASLSFLARPVPISVRNESSQWLDMFYLPDDEQETGDTDADAYAPWQIGLSNAATRIEELIMEKHPWASGDTFFLINWPGPLVLFVERWTVTYYEQQWWMVMICNSVGQETPEHPWPDDMKEYIARVVAAQRKHEAELHDEEA